MRRLARWQEKHGEGDDFTGRRAFAEKPERWVTPYGTNAGQGQGVVDGTGLDQPRMSHVVDSSRPSEQGSERFMLPPRTQQHVLTERV